MQARSPRVGLLLRGGSYAYQEEVVVGAHQECKARGVDLYCLSGGNVTTADPRNFIYALASPGELDAAIVVKGTLGANDGDAVVTALLERLRPLPVCIIGPAEPGIPCIAVDNSSGVRLLIQFGSESVREYARAKGYLELFAKAGVEVIEPGCGACIGCGPGVSDRPDQVTVSAINRNFAGRSGPGKLYLASPLTVAASAIQGKIVAYEPGMFRQPVGV